MKNNKFISKKGFTILELLIVVAIIGLLSAVVLASLNSSRSKGRDAKRIEEIRQVINALELHYSATGQYLSRAQFRNTDKATNPLSKYLWPIPRDPKTGNFYDYTGIRRTSSVDSPCIGYHIGGTFENNHKLLQSDSDARTDGGNAFRCVKNIAGTTNNLGANPGFNGLDNSSGANSLNQRYRYDIRR